jgi:hypothetical protein
VVRKCEGKECGVCSCAGGGVGHCGFSWIVGDGRLHRQATVGTEGAWCRGDEMKQ